ncbi:MAG: PKD domain-containing protein, partial [Flammeovirgaceae bacterium]
MLISVLFNSQVFAQLVRIEVTVGGCIQTRSKCIDVPGSFYASHRVNLELYQGGSLLTSGQGSESGSNLRCISKTVTYVADATSIKTFLIKGSGSVVTDAVNALPCSKSANSGSNWQFQYDGAPTYQMTFSLPYDPDYSLTASVVVTNLSGTGVPPLTSNIYSSNDYGCGSQFRLFANFGNNNCFPISYLWNFGDGTLPITVIPTATDNSSIFHQYASPGTYTVTLDFESKCNGSVLVSKTRVTRQVTVTSVLSSKLDFNFQNATCGTVFTPIPIHPDKNCTNVAYEWDFGDGTPKSNLYAPSHIYSRAGSYTVSLKLNYSCDGCQKFITYQKTITAPELAPIASFSQQYNSCTTTFNATINSNCTKTTYLWDFGDGITSTVAQPSHTYATAGVYSTTLTLGYQCSTGCNGQYIITKPTTILAPEAPAVDFTFQNYKCEINFTSSVTHESTNCSTVSYLWNFGDGTTSTDINPAHLYSSAGAYNVSLALTYQCGNTCPA